MIARIASAYIKLLLVLSALLFTSQLIVHLVVLISGEKKLADACSLNSIRAAVIVGLPVMPFLQSSTSWMDQIKTTPSWMWKAGGWPIEFRTKLTARARTASPPFLAFDFLLLPFSWVAYLLRF